MSTLLWPKVWDKLIVVFTSVRAKVRDGIDGHSASDNYWLRCLYEGENGDPEDVEKGFLKSTLIVKVWAPPVVLKSVCGSLTAHWADLPSDLYIALIRRREP